MKAKGLPARSTSAIRLGGLLLVCLLPLSCDTGTFDPFDNGERYFTLFGYLDERESEHTLRVIPLSRFPAEITDPSEPQASIDGVVTSTDVRTGVVTRWNHRLDRLDDGNYGHVFRGRFQVRPGRTYRVEITRNDGKVTAAETTIPRFPVTVPDPDTLFFPYEVSPDSALTQEVHLPGIVSPWEIYLDYDLQGTWVRVPYGRSGSRTEDGWKITVELNRDAVKMREVLGIPPGGRLPLLHAISISVRALDDSWDPPAGEFDPEVLAQPGVLSNVELGYGFWGGIGSYIYTWRAPGLN
ncbi:MAG: hypothetical protein HKN29_01095 [Rhodothermales bacterium]|nr:hypothetical protein [Rhodothermales bacterium]